LSLGNQLGLGEEWGGHRSNLRVTVRPTQRKEKNHSLWTLTVSQVLCHLLCKPYIVGKTIALFSQLVLHL